MPKPRPKRAPSPVAGDPRSSPTLEQVRRRGANDHKLLDLLGLREPQNLAEINDQNRIVREVEVLLQGFKPLLTNPPPSDAYWREGLAQTLAAAEKLHAAFDKWSMVADYLDGLSEQAGINFRAETVGKVSDILRAEVGRLREESKRKSPGRPRSDMLAHLVLSLGEYFEREYRGSASDQRARLIARNKFVRHVVRSHGIYTDIGPYLGPKAAGPKKR